MFHDDPLRNSMIRQKSRTKSKVPMTITSINDSSNTISIAQKTSTLLNMHTIIERRRGNARNSTKDSNLLSFTQKININQSPPRK